MKNKLLLVLPLLMINHVNANEGFYDADLENRWTTEISIGNAEGHDGEADFAGIRQSFHVDKNFAFDFGYRTAGKMETHYAEDLERMFNLRSTSQRVEAFELGVHVDKSFNSAFSVELNGGFAFLNVDKERSYSPLNTSSSWYQGTHIQQTGWTDANIDAAQTQWEDQVENGGTQSKSDSTKQLYFGFAAKYHFTDNSFVSARYHKVDGFDYDDYSIGIGITY